MEPLDTLELVIKTWEVNPQAVIQALRFKGFPIYLNTVSDTKGRTRNVYRLGTPSRAVIAAGYKAMASGLV